ncbi:hypothetical protein G3R49_08800 [Shewanella sp. WXL01]|uniref:HzsA-related protein n=1 Tax=Shewanella sp. WXL01 TaxID=2709721 RepID=UPI00143849B5|nr:hypothetical protein [Shewanella sp. WXL01]NKF50668.1 hypothetical protein [Shewanella sp. WXL01]
MALNFVHKLSNRINIKRNNFNRLTHIRSRSPLAFKTSAVFACYLLTACNTETAVREQQADPVLVEYPVIMLQRSHENIDNNIAAPIFDISDPTRFNGGAELWFKQNAFADTLAENISHALFATDGAESAADESPHPIIDIRDLSLADDGQSFLVSIRAPEIEGVDEDEQPSWNIWRFDLATKSFSRIIADDTTAELADDLMASYLPDGRIIFASTRQKLSRAILLDEGKPQYTALDEFRDDPTFNIHIMDGDGSNIKQLTFNLSHDFYPLILQNGKVLYSRLDAMGGNHGINLYSMNPDGTDNQLVFGWHSHNEELNGQLTNLNYIGTKQLPDGQVYLLAQNNDETLTNRQPISINITDFIDNRQTIADSNITGSAIADIEFTSYQFNFSDQINPDGRLSSLFALPDESQRYLISWDLCRVIVEEQIRSCGQLTDEQLASPDINLAPALYELWLLDNANNTQQLVATPEPNTFFTEALVMQATSTPKTFIADRVAGNELDFELYQAQAGALHIRSVYDFDGQDVTITNATPNGINDIKDPTKVTAAQHPVRYLRIVRGVPMPPDEVRDIPNTDFGRSSNQLMREIIGYTPVQPDGSVKVKVPANTPFAISMLDANGQRIGGRHQQWMSVRPGETLNCIGCHTASSTAPHGRYDAQPQSINSGAIGGSAFANTKPSLIAEQGQTMAEVVETHLGLPELSSDLVYQDIWTDEALSALNPDERHEYQALTTLVPNGSSCFNQWNAYCRIQINYEEHIQPLWQTPRLVVDEQTQELIADNTCIACHNRVDGDALAMVPAGQLELLNSPSSDQAAHMTSYRELFFNDVELEEIEGVLVDRLVELLDENGEVVYQTDADGELILDEEGNPIPVMTTVPVNSILRTGGAAASSRFFEVMANPTHQGMLTSAELKLISEWLDIGAQYYNTPFYTQE